MKNKGFTLIELLAVIVILAIIALIATPIVLNIINDVNNKADEINIKSIKKAVELYIYQSEIDKKSNISGNIYKEVVKNIKGETPDNGIVYVNNAGEVAFAIKYGNKCYTKKYDKEEIKVEETDTCIAPVSFLMKAGTEKGEGQTFLGGKIAKSTVEKIYTVATNKVPDGVIDSWDVSSEESEDGSVMAWYLDVDANGLYELYIGQDGGVKANPDSSFLFIDFINVIEIDLTHFDTSNVTDMTYMFYSCAKLTKINMKKAIFNKINAYGNMFAEDTALTNIIIEDKDAKTWLESRLSENGLTNVVVSNS